MQPHPPALRQQDIGAQETVIDNRIQNNDAAFQIGQAACPQAEGTMAMAVDCQTHQLM